jgi:ComF family protein
MSLGQSFGVLMRAAFDAHPELHSAQAFVPVPLHSQRERLRGFNQASVLARALAKHTGHPVLDELLTKSAVTRPQMLLSKAERRLNLAQSFEVSPIAQGRLKGKSFLLIDDVCTTGSTLTACARVLRRAGARDVKALTLAREL